MRSNGANLPMRFRDLEIARSEKGRGVTEVPVILRPWSGGEIEAWRSSYERRRRSWRSVNAMRAQLKLELQSPNPNPPRAPTIAFMRAGLPSSLQTWRPYHRARWSDFGNLRCPFQLSHTLIIIFHSPHSLGRWLIFPHFPLLPPLTFLPLSFFHLQ